MTQDGQRRYPLAQPLDNAAEVAKWNNVKVLAQEMEKELREVQSFYWVGQMVKLQHRATFEVRKSQRVDGDGTGMWYKHEPRIE